MLNPRLWYVNIFVSDLKRAVEFYQNTLGPPVWPSRPPQTFTVRLAATQQAIDFARREPQHHRMEDAVETLDAAIGAVSAELERDGRSNAQSPGHC